MRIILFGLALALAFPAFAELTYPVDHTALWQTIDTDTCTTVGSPKSWPALDPDTYDCATEPCGIDSGYPANYKPLKVTEAGPFPEYDSNLSRVQSPFSICGPDINTCYDASCSATDEFLQIHTVIDLSAAQRLAALNNQAAYALLASVTESDRDLMVWLSVLMLMQLNDGATLPTDFQGVNFAALYAKYKADYLATATPVIIRRTELKERIIAEPPTIQDGEISSGWPDPAE